MTQSSNNKEIYCRVSGKDCYWWRELAQHGSKLNDNCACHFCLDTGKMRRRGPGNECFEYAPPKEDDTNGNEL